MTEFYLAMLLVGGLVLLLGLFAKSFYHRWYLTEPLVVVLLGIAVGPAGLGLLHLAAAGEPSRVLEEVARITLAVADMGVALRLPRGYVNRQWRPLALVLSAGMVLMCLSSGLLIWGLLGVPFWVAILIGASVTSTDPVVASTIVTGDVAEKNVPSRVRHFISAESGANDGAVFPLVLLPVMLLTLPLDQAIVKWALNVVLWQVGGAILLGCAVGCGASRLLMWAEKSKVVEKGAFLAYTFALTFVVLGLARLLSINGVLAVFVAGLA